MDGGRRLALLRIRPELFAKLVLEEQTIRILPPAEAKNASLKGVRYSHERNLFYLVLESDDFAQTSEGDLLPELPNTEYSYVEG